ncbi:hypothetical protein ACP4OV_002282 [Aristida adscensionis]
MAAHAALAAWPILQAVFKCFDKLKTAVEMVHENERSRYQIKMEVDMLKTILFPLQERPSMMEDSGIRTAVEKLGEIFELAQNGCEKGSTLAKLGRARADAQKLRQMLDRIFRGVVFVNAALNLNTNCMLRELAKSNGIQSTGRSGEEGAKNTVPPPSDSLPPENTLEKYPFGEVEKAVDPKHCIGEGGSGNVYEGKLRGKVVAIKEFHMLDQYKSPEFIDKLIQLLSKLQHENIVEHLGHSRRKKNLKSPEDTDRRYKEEKDPGKFFLVTKYMDNDCLKPIIKGRKTICWPTHFSIIQGLAKGLRYLHEKSIVHLDLKPSNILLDAEMIPKINDFGTARELDQEGDVIKLDTDHLPGTDSLRGYMPLELMTQGFASFKSDVYSFGVLLLETLGRICTGSEIFPDRPMGPNEWIILVNGVSELKNLFNREQLSDHGIKIAINCLIMGLRCCQTDPTDRPFMDEVVEQLAATQQFS